MKTIKLTVYGRVQGVGFRYTTKMIADKMGITGTVHNNEDGSVTTFASGENDLINSFKEKIINNPSPTSKVTNYEFEEISYQDYPNFEII